MSRIETTLRGLRQADRTALMPYLTVGYPERDSALTLIPALVDGGADLIELGVPFSDPLADGPTIQAAGQQALRNGITLTRCLGQAAALRHQGVTVPFVLMGYYNPILQLGVAAFAAQAARAGIDGVIVPDLPPEEAAAVRAACAAHGLDLIFLLAPTADTARIDIVTACTDGFVYLVSLVGVTGARDHLSEDLATFVARVRSATDKPLAVGFGISTPAQAARVARIADGVIVGSALIDAISYADAPAEAAARFVEALRVALDAARSAP